jgi:hypothetical protein
MAWGENTRPYLKNSKSKKGWGVAQVVEFLPSKCKALISNPITAKKTTGSIHKKQSVCSFMP